MATTTISLSVDAYDILKSHKVEGESFSEVVRRLFKPKRKRSLMEFASTWADIPDDRWTEIEAVMREFRNGGFREFLEE